MTSIKKYEDKLNNIIKTLGIENNMSNNYNSEKLYHIKNDTVTTVSPSIIKKSIKESFITYIKYYWIYIILSLMCFSIIFVLKPKFLIYTNENKKEILNISRYLLFSSIVSIILSISYNRFIKNKL
jgi:hypothetical protein